jgi:hypothetical protein
MVLIRKFRHSAAIEAAASSVFRCLDAVFGQLLLSGRSGNAEFVAYKYAAAARCPAAARAARGGFFN